MARFHSLTVSDVRREIDDAVSVAFDVPADLADEFSFKPGQYLTLRADIDGQDVRRSYSICTAAYEGQLRVAIKRVKGGLFSNFANDALAPGATLQVMAPMGNFTTELDGTKRRRYVGFAGGSGITPVISILKSVLADEPESEFTLFYGNRSIDSIIFREELEDLKNTHMGRLRLFHILSEEARDIDLYSGVMNEAKCGELLDGVVREEKVDHFFICGPEPMMLAAKAALESRGVADERIHIELFTSPLGKLTPQAREDAPVGDGPLTDVTIVLDGKRTHFKLAQDGPSVLDAALKRGLDLPFACKGGVCCTCRAKVIEGDVKMDVNYSLEKDEMDAGFVLTCQSHPLTDTLVVDYDHR